MIDLGRVSAVLVTRGDVPMKPILDEIYEAGIDDVCVWDNSKMTDVAVFGRYAGIRHALGDLIYVQDDDAIVAAADILRIIAAHEPGRIVANMPERFRHDFYTDNCLVGFGAAFDRGLPYQAWKRFADFHHPERTTRSGSLAGSWLARFHEGFARDCDRVFTALTPYVLVDVPYSDREFASAPGRLWVEPGHRGRSAGMLDLARQART